MRSVLFVFSIAALLALGRQADRKSNYCSNPTIKILNNTVKCTIDPLQTYNPSCRSWNIMAAITFLNSSRVKSQLIQVASYLNETGAACDCSSQLQIVTPKWGTCSDYGLWGNSSTFLMNTLINSPNNAVTYPNEVNTAVSSVMSYAFQCANYPSSHAGIVYLFTDFVCGAMLQSEVEKLMKKVKAFLLHGYSVNIVLFNVSAVDSDCSDVLNCLNCTLPYCRITTIDDQSSRLHTCRYDPNSTTTIIPTTQAVTTEILTTKAHFWETTTILQDPNTSTHSKPTITPSNPPITSTNPPITSTNPPITSTNPPITSTNPPITSTAMLYSTGSPPSGLSTLELALIIGLPCISLAVVCCVCVVCCRKCRNRAMVQVGWKRKTMHPGAYEMHTNSSANNANNLAVVANQYMDIQQLAARNKKDYWELPPLNLSVDDNEILGTGAFSNVFKGTITGQIPLLKAQSGISFSIETRKSGTCETAVKRLPAHADEQNRMDFFHEIDFMKRLGYHVHIIAMLGCVSDPWDPLILVEYCHHGDMLNFLRKHRSYLLIDKEDDCPADADMCLHLKDLISFAWQISDGMSYLSSKNFIHRDVAARNVLLTKKLVAKVSDFGLCRYIDSALYTAKGGKLPIKWMAIESLKFYEYSVKTDVWAYGVCLFEIFSMGEGPYQAIQPLDMLKHLENGNRLERPDKCPIEIYELMLRCWEADATLRPTFSDIRDDLSTMLNSQDEHYGYLAFDANNLPQKRTSQEISPPAELDGVNISD